MGRFDSLHTGNAQRYSKELGGAPAPVEAPPEAPLQVVNVDEQERQRRAAAAAGYAQPNEYPLVYDTPAGPQRLYRDDPRAQEAAAREDYMAEVDRKALASQWQDLWQRYQALLNGKR
jgi:hypothetical protein